MEVDTMICFPKHVHWKEKALDLGVRIAICWLCNLEHNNLASLFLTFLIFKIGLRHLLFHKTTVKWNKTMLTAIIIVVVMNKSQHPLAFGITCKCYFLVIFCNTSAQSERGSQAHSFRRLGCRMNWNRPTKCQATCWVLSYHLI